jgi:hypothetical protein
MKDALALRRRLAAAAKSLQSAIEDGAVPYVVVHRAQLPTGFDASKYHGLLFCYTTVTKDGTQEITSHWRSKKAYEQYGTSFASAFTPSAATEGTFSGFHRKTEPLWKNHAFWATLVSFLTLFGLTAALWEQIAKVFERPVVYINASAENNPDLLVDTPSLLKFYVTNQCRFAPIKVDIQGTFVPCAGSPHDFRNSRVHAVLSRIPPGETREFSAREKITDSPATGTGKPIQRCFRIRAQSTGLLFSSSKWWTMPAVNVWKAHDLSLPEKAVAATRGWPSGGEDVCTAKGTFYSGRGGTARGYIVVTTPVPLGSATAVIAGEKVPLDPSPKRTAADASFQTPPLQPFLDYRYQVTVYGGGIRNACDRIVRDLKIGFN